MFLFGWGVLFTIVMTMSAIYVIKTSEGGSDICFGLIMFIMVFIGGYGTSDLFR